MYISLFLFVPLALCKGFSAFNRYPKRYLPYKDVRNLYRNIYKIGKNEEYTLEHIVPQSHMKHDNKLKRDMHNIIYYPKMLNTHRSNYKYTCNKNIYNTSAVLDKYGYKVNDEKYDPKLFSIKTNKKKIFCPPKSYRGEISRACMYFLHTYESFEEKIFDHVLDPDTLILWHNLYPVTDFEFSKNEIIKDMQGNENPFISNPTYLNELMEDLLSKNKF